jgi:uncharacterized protein YutE (UPF0331/DUF86 family)
MSYARALEGVLNISAHILSRIPGGQATQYAEIARMMDPSELYDILKNNLVDFDIFMDAVKRILNNPEKFGLKVE